MSSIWTRCGGISNRKRLATRAWRAVEGQHRISTRKLTDSDDEQALLEELLERSKPPAARVEGLHYLLSTPFRYPPLRHGSRFGVRTERGIWYGAEGQRTCFAEVAYYRIVFLEGTTADLSPLHVELTAFRAVIRTARGVDLMASTFDRYRGRIASPSRYETAQRLGPRHAGRRRPRQCAILRRAIATASTWQSSCRVRSRCVSPSAWRLGFVLRPKSASSFLERTTSKRARRSRSSVVLSK